MRGHIVIGRQKDHVSIKKERIIFKRKTDITIMYCRRKISILLYYPDGHCTTYIFSVQNYRKAVEIKRKIKELNSMIEIEKLIHEEIS